MSHAAAVATVAPQKRPRIFYGWWIVVGAIVAQFVAIGMQGQVSGVFLRPMTEDLGWTRAQFTIATSLGTGFSGAIGFFIGASVDRYGARPLMVIGATIVGGTLIGISRIEELWQFVLLRGVVFTVGFVLIGNLVVNVTVSKWFVERRGWAISMASLGVSAAGITVPLAMVRVVDEFGWRDGWVVMGVAAWLLIYPVALLMRRQPEDYGLLPDGKIAGTAEDADAVEVARLDYVNSFTRSEAVRTAAMWLLVLGFGLAVVGLISLLFHAIPFLTDNGFTRSEAALLASSQGASALLSKFAWGWAMQRWHPRGLAASSFLLSGGAVVAMVFVAGTGSLPLMFASFIAWGWGIGGMIPLQEFIWASFFGRRHLGAVRSAAMPITILFGAGGPLFAGLYFDAVGSYDGALLTFAALWGLGALFVLLARQPAPKVPSTAPVPVPAVAPVEPSRVGAVTPPPPPAPVEEAIRPVARGVVRPRSYMGDGNGAKPRRDYMRKQLAPPPPAASPVEPDPVQPRPVVPDNPASATTPPPPPAREARPAQAPQDDAPVASSAEFPAAEFIPFEEFDERLRSAGVHVAADGDAERAGRDDPRPDQTWFEEPRFEEFGHAPSAADGPEYRPAPARSAPPALRSVAFVERGVNLGQATRAVQRRLPAALQYYRREGVSSAVVAGVAASMAVTAAVWLLSRDGRSGR